MPFCHSQRGQLSDVDIQKHRRTQRRALAKKRAQEQLRPWTPEPVEGRKHVDVQTGLCTCHWHLASWFAQVSKPVLFHWALMFVVYLLFIQYSPNHLIGEVSSLKELIGCVLLLYWVYMAM